MKIVFFKSVFYENWLLTMNIKIPINSYEFQIIFTLTKTFGTKFLISRNFQEIVKIELLQIDTSNPFLPVTIMFVRFPRKISKWNVKVYSHLWLEIRLVHPFVVDEYLRSNLTSWLEFWPLNLG